MKKIKQIYNISDNWGLSESRYDVWFKKLLNKTEDEVSYKDVYTMFSQNELEELAIKKAIEFIIEDPLAGEMWDGHFLEQLTNVSINKLKHFSKELKELSSSIEKQVDSSLWDFEYEKENYMEILNQFKNMIEKLT